MSLLPSKTNDKTIQPNRSIVCRFFIYNFTVDCIWSSWNTWAECSRPCSGGKRTSNRTIITAELDGGNICEGEDSRTEDCNTDPCSLELKPESVLAEASTDPVDCKWSSFSEWSDCSVTCGNGFKQSNNSTKQSQNRGKQPNGGRARRAPPPPGV